MLSAITYEKVLYFNSNQEKQIKTAVRYVKLIKLAKINMINKSPRNIVQNYTFLHNVSGM